jgi:hypothetical protein
MATPIEMAHESSTSAPSGWLQKFITAPLTTPSASSIYTL